MKMTKTHPTNGFRNEKERESSNNVRSSADLQQETPLLHQGSFQCKQTSTKGEGNKQKKTGDRSVFGVHVFRDQNDSLDGPIKWMIYYQVKMGCSKI